MHMHTCTHAHLQAHIFAKYNKQKFIKKTIRWLECGREVVGSRGQAIEREASSGDRKLASTGQGGGGEGKVGEQEQGKERELEFVYKILKDCFKKKQKRKRKPASTELSTGRKSLRFTFQGRVCLLPFRIVLSSVEFAAFLLSVSSLGDLCHESSSTIRLPKTR